MESFSSLLLQRHQGARERPSLQRDTLGGGKRGIRLRTDLQLVLDAAAALLRGGVTWGFCGFGMPDCDYLPRLCVQYSLPGTLTGTLLILCIVLCLALYRHVWRVL
jgi:hypothetical protein